MKELTPIGAAYADLRANKEPRESCAPTERNAKNRAIANKRRGRQMKYCATCEKATPIYHKCQKP